MASGTQSAPQSHWAWFDHFAKGAAWVSGRPVTFLVAVGLLLVWLATGPIFLFDNTWQLIVNTATTIVTFLMVFLIQSTQNRDTAAIHLKLDEIIRALDGARNSVMDLEDKAEDELLEAHKEYVELAEKAHEELHERGLKVARPGCDDNGDRNRDR